MKLFDQVFYLVLLFFVCRSHALFDRDRAAYCAQNQEWEKSVEILQPSLTKQPDNAQTLYGLGVASYKKQEYGKASAYFNAALEYETDTQKKEELFFNYGNSLAFQKKLPEAVDAYESAIKINSNNEQTKHNLEVVKKMLENQEQQQQNNQQNQQQENQDKNNEQQQDQKNKQDQQNNQNDNQDNKDSEQNQNSDGQQEQQGNQDQQEHDGNSEQNKEQKNQGEDGDRQDKSGEDKQPQDDAGKDSGNKPQQQNGNDKGDSERGDHNESPQEGDEQKDSPGQDTKEEEKEQEMPSGGFGDKDDAFQELDARLAQLLELQEQKDADLSKKIIQMQVDKELAGQDGQNRW